MDVAAWLRGLGLEQYAPAFHDNAIDGEVLRDLTADDLKDLGITLIGHRRKLLAAIAALDASAPTRDAASARSASNSAPSVGAERRQLTVMFCDLVGSTALSVRLDPEDLREVIGAYHAAVAAEVGRLDGYVAKYMGDGALVYFGYPRAHEDDAERAVRTGLALAERVARIETQVSLAARIGIATGLVVVGDLIGAGDARERGVVGETPNLAARMQELAPSGGVVIAERTRRLLGDLFELRDLGALKVKGLDAPVPVWHVLRPSTVESRFEALRGAALTQIVGRDDEIDLLLRRWARTKAGDGQVVLVSGEPGIGKSRITAAVVEHIRAEPHLRLRYFCSPYHTDSALYPFLAQLERAAGFAREDTAEAKLAKLEALLTLAEPPDADVAFIADLLSLPASERHPLPNLSPQRKKERTLEAVIRQLDGLARRQPVLMVFEDAQWIDPTSRELLDLIVERVRSLPVLLIVTFRPEFQAPWTGQPQVTMVAVNRLDRRDRVVLVEQIAGGKALPDDVLDQIADRTDGVPLFVEELTKSMLESGLLREEANRYVLDSAVPRLGIPTTLHDSLMARLDRLAPVRHVAQIGAAIGREFSYALLRTVSRLPEDELQTALGRLVNSELVFQRGTPPDAVYTFKHALVQDTAHGSLLRNVRQQLHAQIAEALEAHSPEMMENQPELLAQHYSEAGLVEKAIAYWAKARSRSATRLAMAEAAAQLRKGLEQLALLPHSRERLLQELEFHSDLGDIFNNIKGQAAPETGHAYARARELWEQLGSPSEYFQVPLGQSRYYAYGGQLDLAQRLAEDLLRLSRQRRDAVGLMLGNLAFGRTLFLTGSFAASRTHLEEARALFDPISHGSSIRWAAQLQLESQCYLGSALFCLGFPSQAAALINEAIVEARRLAHPRSLANALNMCARLHVLDGNDTALREPARELTEVAAEHGFAVRQAQGTVYRGWVKVKNGAVVEGISLLRSGSTAFRATGSDTLLPQYIALLARACEIAGQIEEAVTLVDDALEMTERIGGRWLEAELNRLKGQLLLRQGHSEAAEELYRTALSIAEEQQAKLWELRAAASLARLRRDQGRRAEARDLLAPVYDWFTEGFDIPDLRESKALLDELL